MSFGSSITLLKQFVVTGSFVSLLCISGASEAVQRVVYDGGDGGAPNTLRDRINEANTSGTDDEIVFDLGADATINAFTVMPTITRDMAINAIGYPNLQVNAPGGIAGPLFAIDPGVRLALIGTRITTGNNNWAGSITNNGTVLFQQTETSIYGGNITGIGSLVIDATSLIGVAQDLTFTGSSTYTGPTYIVGGGFTIGANDTLPITTIVNIAGLSALTLNNGINQTLGGLTGSGAVRLGTGSTLTLNANVNNTFPGVVAGPVNGNFTKTGTGTETLSGLNTATGTLLINNGGIKITSTGRWSGPVQIGAAALEMNGGTVTGAITGDGTANSILDVTGIFTPTAAVTNVGTINVDLGGNFTVNPGLAPTGFSNFTIAPGGALTLNTNFSVPIGATLTNAGTLTMNNNNLLMGSGSTFNSNANLTPTGYIISQGGGGYTLRVGNNSTFTVNNAIPVSGYTSFNVNAGSTLNLSTDYTVAAGATLTNAGTLAMNNNRLLMGAGSTFDSNASLTTTGSIEGAGYALNVGGGSTLGVNNPIVGYTTLTVNGSTTELNNGGSLLNGIALSNNGIFTIRDGTFAGNITNPVGDSTLNICNTFTPPGTVNVDTLNVKSGAIFTPNAAVTTNSALHVDNGGTLLLTNNISGAGTVINAGTITHTANATRTIGGFTQQGTGIINIGITAPGAGNYSQFSVLGNTILNGGTVNVALSSPLVINGGETFDIITSGGVVAPNPILPTVVSTSSLFIHFTPTVFNNKNLRLTANRLPYKDFNDIPALEGIAGALDGLTSNSQFDPVLGLIDGVTSQSEYEAILEELAPAGLNGLYAVSMEGLGGADQALLRLETMRDMGTQGVLARTGYTRGYAAGDMLENEGSYGPMVFGNSTKQESRNGLPGYNAVTAGFGFLGDVPILEYFRIGLGVSYANSAVKQSNNTGSNTTIGSTQGLAYGSATYGPLFLDSVLSAGMNNYHGKRNMPLFNQMATSAYTGFQYGAKVKGGFTIPCGQAEISPTAGVQYMHLNVGQYTEKGAGILNQQVSPTKTGTVRAMLGGRLADRSQEEDFFPEIHAFYIVDVRNPNVLITSRFAAGGGSFVSTSALPPKSGVNVGASLTALVTDDFVISGSYDLEAKKSFRSHSASLKFKFLF